MICASLGAVICAPSSQYTLYPLYSGGLWLAVTTIPAVQPSVRSAKDSSGVGRRLSKMYALIPFAANTHAAVSANSGDIRRESNAIATPFAAAPCLLIKFARPCVAFPTV